MGAGAQVGEVALLVNGELPALGGVLFQQLQLVGLAGENFAALLHGDDPLFQGQVLFDDLLHLGFDGLKVAGGQGPVGLDVVVPAVLQRRADAEVGAGEQMLYRLGHHMGRGVPESVLAALVLKGEDLQGAVLVQNGAQVAHLAVHLGSAGALVEAHADALGHVGRGHARLELANVPFQFHIDHVLKTSCKRKNAPPRCKTYGMKHRAPRFHPNCAQKAPLVWAVTGPARRGFAPALGGGRHGNARKAACSAPRNRAAALSDACLCPPVSASTLCGIRLCPNDILLLACCQYFLTICKLFIKIM